MAAKWSIPEDLLARVINKESSFNPNAKSGVGAQGLMQLMPDTARAMGVTNPLNATQSVNGGAQYLKGLYDTYKDWPKALAGYNAGGSKVKAAVAQYGKDWLSHMPKETQNYVKAIMGG